jgi:hypothetical protein
MWKKALLPIVDGNVNWCSHYRKWYGDTSKTYKRTTMTPAIPVVGVCPKEMGNQYMKKISAFLSVSYIDFTLHRNTLISITALFINS